MKSTEQTEDQKLYSQYVQALQRENEQFQIERRTMEKQIEIIQCQLNEATEEKEKIAVQLQNLIVKTAGKDKEIQKMRRSQIDAEKMIKIKNEQIRQMDEYFKEEMVRSKQEMTKLKDKIDISELESRIQSYNLQRFQQKKSKNKMGRVYSQLIYFQEEIKKNKTLKQFLETKEISNSEERIKILQILSTLKDQQDGIKQNFLKFDGLSLLLKKKEQEIKSLEFSNQHLRNLNQSLINKNTQYLESAKILKQAQNRRLKKNNQEMTTIAHEDENFEVQPQFQTRRRHRCKNINFKSCKSELLVSMERYS